MPQLILHDEIGQVSVLAGAGGIAEQAGHAAEGFRPLHGVLVAIVVLPYPIGDSELFQVVDAVNS